MKRVLCLLLMILCACSARLKPSETPGPVSSAETAAEIAVQTAAPIPETELPTKAPAATAAPTPAPTEEPTPLPTLIAKPTPAPTKEPGQEPFTIVWASDTQTMIAYTRLQPAFLSMCDWIVDQAEEQNFVAFFHTGDMVDDGDNYGQWRLFRSGVDRIAEKMPFFWAVGNHDEGSRQRRPWKNQPFVKALQKDHVYNKGETAYMILTVGDVQLLILSVCYRSEGGNNAADWLCEVCETYRDLPAVLLVHSYLTAEGGLTDLAVPLEKSVVSQCPNIRLVLCGHTRGIMRTAFRYDDDGDGVRERIVNALMYDVQTEVEQVGYLCLLTYDPADNSLSVTSYSPYLDDYIFNDEYPEREQFTLNNVF